MDNKWSPLSDKIPKFGLADKQENKAKNGLEFFTVVYLQTIKYRFFFKINGLNTLDLTVTLLKLLQQIGKKTKG